MEHLLHVDELIHDLGLADIPRYAIEHQRIDIGLELMPIDCGVDPRFPELHRNLIRDQLAFAGVFQKRAADRRAGIDGAKDIAAGAMKKARNGSERFALGALTAAGRPEEEVGFIFHARIVYSAKARRGTTTQMAGTEQAPARSARREQLLRRDRGLDHIHAAPRAVELHLAINQRENRVVASETDVFPRQKLRAALADDDVAGHDCFAAKFFHAETFADAIPAVLNAALSLFMSHEIKLKPPVCLSSWTWKNCCPD